MSTVEATPIDGLFSQLAPILDGRTLLITVSKNSGDALTVNVIPKGGDAQESEALRAPLCFTGTAAELDRDWLSQLRSFVEAHQALSSNLTQIRAEMEEAEKEARARARKKTTGAKKSEPSRPAPPPEPPKPATPTSLSLFDTSTAQEPAPTGDQSGAVASVQKGEESK